MLFHEGQTASVTGISSGGMALTGLVKKFERQSLIFEVGVPEQILRCSEVLTEFRVSFQERPLFIGQAVIKELVAAGGGLLCHVSLPEDWMDANASLLDASTARQQFAQFISSWEKHYKILPEFKVVTADLAAFLDDLRLWTEQLDLQIRSAPSADRSNREREALIALGPSLLEAINNMHERFEALGRQIPPEMRAAHQAFARRQLQSLFLTSPFGHRAYSKPLGYAGDYQMVAMILEDPWQGTTAFAKVMNFWLLHQWPSVAHRNRIDYLVQRLKDETARVYATGRRARILNLGCGPAREVERFIAESPLSDYADFVLLDFNDETVNYTRALLEQARVRHGRRCQIEVIEKSVQEFLKSARKRVDHPSHQFDLIYCAGLFDYLSDRTCQQLVEAFCGRMLPEGLVALTNVVDSQPFRLMLEFILDWHLIYRHAPDTEAFMPANREGLEKTVFVDESGVNVFIELRRI